MWLLQLLESQGKHSSSDRALQPVEEGRVLCRNAEDLVGTGEERRAGSLAVFGMDLTDTRVQEYERGHYKDELDVFWGELLVEFISERGLWCVLNFISFSPR